MNNYCNHYPSHFHEEFKDINIDNIYALPQKDLSGLDSFDFIKET